MGNWEWGMMVQILRICIIFSESIVSIHTDSMPAVVTLESKEIRKDFLNHSPFPIPNSQFPIYLRTPFSPNRIVSLDNHPGLK